MRVQRSTLRRYAQFVFTAAQKSSTTDRPDVSKHDGKESLAAPRQANWHILECSARRWHTGCYQVATIVPPPTADLTQAQLPMIALPERLHGLADRNC